MSSQQELKDQAKTLRTVFFVALGIYVVSFALPSFGGGGGMMGKDTLFGIQCFFFSLIFSFTSPVFFIGALANFILISFYIMMGVRTGKGNHMVIDLILVGITIISAWIWLIFALDGNDTLKLGYYVWALSVTAMSVMFVLIMHNRHKAYKLGEDDKEYDDLDALILDE